MTAHEIVTAPDLAPPSGYAHAVLAAPGRTVYLGGQTAQGPDGAIAGNTVVEQFEQALRNLLSALHAAGGRSEHLVSITVYTTDVDAYRDAARALGEVWRAHLGRHYPAMALLGVSRLYDAAALVELVGVAVIT